MEVQANIEHYKFYIVNMIILACGFFFAFDIFFVFKIMFSTMTSFNSIFRILKLLFLSGFSFDFVLNSNNTSHLKILPHVSDALDRYESKRRLRMAQFLQDDQVSTSLSFSIFLFLCSSMVFS